MLSPFCQILKLSKRCPEWGGVGGAAQVPFVELYFVTEGRGEFLKFCVLVPILCLKWKQHVTFADRGSKATNEPSQKMVSLNHRVILGGSEKSIFISSLLSLGKTISKTRNSIN